MNASRYCSALILPSTTPWPTGRLTSSAASTPKSRCCCAEPSTMPDECRKRPSRCQSEADHGATMPDIPADADAAVIAVEHLHKAYGTTVAVDDVSFSVRAGEIFGV